MSFKKIEREQGSEPSLRCAAHGCPTLWSVDCGNGKLCSYHAWEEPHKWPRITDDLNRMGPWELSPKREVDTSNYPGEPKAWAKRLQDRHARGEHLSRLQISMYRDALRLIGATA